MTIGLCFLVGGWFSTLVSENNGIFVFFRVKQKIIKATAKVILKDLFIIIIYLFVFFFLGYWSFCECRSEESNSRGGGGVKNGSGGMTGG